MPPIKPPSKAPAKKAPAKKKPPAPPTPVPVPVKASARALSAFDASFGKRFGAGAISTPVKRRYRVVSTGSLTWDLALGCGGFVTGRVHEVWGPEGTLKTTASLIQIGNFQREYPDRIAAIINMERTFDAEWAEVHGVDLRRLRVVDPHNSEEVGDMCRQMIESGLFSLVVLDSVGGMVTDEEMRNDAEKASMGTAAKVVTRMVKQAAVLCADTDTTLLIINQQRAILSHTGGTTTGGGYALKHVTTSKSRLRRTATDPYCIGTGDKSEQVGIELAVIVEKNKVAPPRRVAVFAHFGTATEEYGPIGIDRAREAVTMGLRYGIIGNPALGSYLLPGEEKVVRGEAKTIARLREDPALLDKVRRELLARIADQVRDEVPEDDPEPDIDGPVAPAEGEVLDFASGLADVEPDIALLDQLREDERLKAVQA